MTGKNDIELIPASDDDIKGICLTLHDATNRPKSSDFLDGFPCATVNWYRGSIDEHFLLKRNIYLFWDRMAWDDDYPLVRSLQKGAEDFMMLDENRDNRGLNQCVIEHINGIKTFVEDFKTTGINLNQTDFLILVANNDSGPFLIVDGNHRAAAMLWCLHNSVKLDLPKNVWLGTCDDMVDYPRYQLVLIAEESRAASRI